MKKYIPIIVAIAGLILLAGSFYLYMTSSNKGVISLDERTVVQITKYNTENCTDVACGTATGGDLDTPVSYSMILPEGWLQKADSQEELSEEVLKVFGGDYAEVTISDTEVIYQETGCEEELNSLVDFIVDSDNAQVLLDNQKVENGGLETYYSVVNMSEEDTPYVWIACTENPEEKTKYYFSASSQYYEENNVNNDILNIINSIEISE